MLNENLDEIREYCQEAFEDALLMGCDERLGLRGFRIHSQGHSKPLRR